VAKVTPAFGAATTGATVLVTTRNAATTAKEAVTACVLRVDMGVTGVIRPTVPPAAAVENSGPQSVVWRAHHTPSAVLADSRMQHGACRVEPAHTRLG
jgi:hypothetical protein